MEELESLELYNDDCFNVFPKIKNDTVNLFVLDLPYNQTACKWDKDIIPLDKMWDSIKRIMKPNGIVIMFCTAKFGYRLIHSNPKWFRYDLIWKKSRKVGFLSANKMPLRQHENIYLFKPEGGTYNPQKTPRDKDYKHSGKRSSEKHYGNMLECKKEYKKEDGKHPTSIIDHENLYVFSDACNDDLDISRNKDLRLYAQKVKDYIGKGLKQINKDMGNRHAEHFFYIKSTQFGIPTETTYANLNALYHLDEMPEFLPYKTLKEMWEKEPETTYNPQKTKGKPYLIKEHKLERQSVYGSITVPEHMNKTGDRHPSSLIDYDGDSILIYKNPHKTIHRTQKPVELCEWLIKTYSNEGDTVMDFTMGSGTVAIGCLNTNRKFIGVEKDKEIYEKAQDRIAEHIIN